MNILLVGNSQLACLKKAYDVQPEILGQFGDISFYVTPGGTGPYLTVNNGLLELIKEGINPKFPPRAYPENTPSIPLDNYDLIVVSALGYIDGGFYYPSPATRQGIIFDFCPKPNAITSRYISVPCYKKIIEGTLLSQPGIKFLMILRKYFCKDILVQPFPLPSKDIQNHPEWPLNSMYEDVLGAHKFFCQERDLFMKNFCEKHNMTLLSYPLGIGREDYFSPPDLMGASDGLHPTERYGELVLRQIANAVALQGVPSE
ncbi:hypothetical protein [Thiorhodococcus drewsii]|nr:hypothetical protein [Thiorhodococcus drewsii]